jgi:hypothetical protein
MYVQVIEEAFSSQKRPSNTSKHELVKKFPTFVGHFCPPGSGSGSNDPIKSGSNPDPDPQPCFKVLLKTDFLPAGQPGERGLKRSSSGEPKKAQPKIDYNHWSHGLLGKLLPLLFSHRCFVLPLICRITVPYR